MGFLARLCLCLSYSSCCGPFIYSCWEAVHLFSKGNDTYVTVDLVCPWEEMSLGSSYTAILGVSQTVILICFSSFLPKQLKTSLLVPSLFFLSSPPPFFFFFWFLSSFPNSACKCAYVSVYMSVCMWMVWRGIGEEKNICIRFSNLGRK